MNSARKQLHNLPSLKPLRRKLRASMTPAEIALWQQLKSSQLAGRKFRRQHSIGQYIVDFYCPAERLVIELDGAPHDTERAVLRDAARDKWLVNLGIRVLRFENRHVINNMQGVLDSIKHLFGWKSGCESSCDSSTLTASGDATTPAASDDPSSDEEGSIG